MSTTKSGVAIQDADYDQIISMCRKNGKRGVTLENSNGQIWWFRLENGDLHAKIRNQDGSVTNSEVFKKSVVMSQQSTPFRETMRQRLRADHPDMSPEEIDINADLLTEANDSIKTLIQSGVDPAVAQAVVKEALKCPVGGA